MVHCGGGAVPVVRGDSTTCVCQYGYKCAGAACDARPEPVPLFAPHSFDPTACPDCACDEDLLVKTRTIPNTLFMTYTNIDTLASQDVRFTKLIVPKEGGGHAVSRPTSTEECALGLNGVRAATQNMKLTFTLLDDDDCLEVCTEVFPEIVPFYKAEPWGQYRGDVCRGCKLLRDGGFYMDMDLVGLVSISDFAPPDSHFMVPWDRLWSTGTDKSGCTVIDPKVLDQRYVDDCNASQFELAGKQMTASFTQAFIGAAPNHPILRRYLDLMLEMKRGTRPWYGWMGTNAMGIAYLEYIASYFGGTDAAAMAAAWAAWPALLSPKGVGMMAEKKVPHDFTDPPDKKRPGARVFDGGCNDALWLGDRLLFYSRFVGYKHCKGDRVSLFCLSRAGVRGPNIGAGCLAAFSHPFTPLADMMWC